jgi:hypothetical protein
MPPTYGCMRATEVRAGGRLRCLATAGSMWLAACAPQDGVVGAMALDGVYADAGTEAGGEIVAFETDFATNGGLWEERVELPGGSVEFGVPSTGAVGGSVALLRFPGDPARGPNDAVGPGYVTQIMTLQTFGFGTYRTSMQPGTCDPGEEVASAVLGYFGDGTDQDGDSITDEIEIDVQFLCGSPELVFLTVFTDYEVDDSGTTQFEKLTRAVDFSTGDVFDTPSFTSYELTLTGTFPELRRPEFPVPGAFYEVGFEWHTDRIEFFLALDGAPQSLWVLTDPARIPQRPVHFMYNLWHPDSHWTPATGSADFPAEDVTLRIDWLTIVAE